MALDYPGTNSNYLHCGNPTNLQFTGAMTVMCWLTLNVGQDISIMTKFASPTRGFTLQTDQDVGPVSYLLFYITSDGTSLFSSGYSTFTLNDGQQYHVAGIFRPSTAVEIWIDGQLNKSNTTGIPASQYNASNNFTVGARSDGTQVPDGTIEDARAYNRALSAEEMQTIYAARGSDGIVDGLVSRWLLNEGAPGTNPSGTNIIDVGGGGNTMTAVGTTTYSGSRLSFRRRTP